MSFQRPKNPQTGMKQPQKAPTFYENSRKRRGGGGPRLPDMSTKKYSYFYTCPMSAAIYFCNQSYERGGLVESNECWKRRKKQALLALLQNIV